MLNIFTIQLVISLSGIAFKPYTLEGKNYNVGDMAEIVYKHCLGLTAQKDTHTSWRAGDDIPEYNRSVKARGFTLTDEYLGDSKEEIISAYMSNVHSSTFSYCVIDLEHRRLIVYTMNREQFRTFLEKFGTLDRVSGRGTKKIRVKHETKKMIQWLEENCRA